MVAQLIQEAASTAAGVLAYSTVCLLSSCLMIWLVWVHHERISYVALLSYFTLLSTLASVVQQIHTIVAWRDVKISQYENAVANLGSIEVAIAGPSTGLDLILFYIQYYSYNVEALLALFWAFALMRSIFGFADNLSVRALRRRAGIAAKFVAVLLPAVLISILQTPLIKSSFWAFLAVANINLFLSLTVGGLLLLIIVIKYIRTRRQLQSWNVQYGKSTQSAWASDLKLDATPPQRDTIYDSWLMIRFTVAFIFLGIFEAFEILFQLSSMEGLSKKHLGPSADLSAERARGDFLLFMPGCTASLLVFLVFGTTKTFLETIRHAVVPRRFRRRTRRAAAAAAATQSTGNLLPSSTTTLPGKLSPVPTGYPERPLSPSTDGRLTFMLQDIDTPRPASLSQEDDWRLTLGSEVGRSLMPRESYESWPAPMEVARRNERLA